jgi:CubicO group peptidase (beta-lactamase class C family)
LIKANSLHEAIDWARRAPSPHGVNKVGEIEIRQRFRIGRLCNMHRPGEMWIYNIGSDVLGVLIARIPGQPLEAYLREQIFRPLGMKDTGFSVPPDKIDRFANFQTGACEAYDPASGGQWSHPPKFPSGAGGLVSTVEDYFAFSEMMRNRGATYGWDGGLGTAWRYDPKEDLTGILLTQRAWTSPVPPKVCLDFWASAYESIGV